MTEPTPPARILTAVQHLDSSQSAAAALALSTVAGRLDEEARAAGLRVTSISHQVTMNPGMRPCGWVSVMALTEPARPTP